METFYAVLEESLKEIRAKLVDSHRSLQKEI
jgi:hypothetical protein